MDAESDRELPSGRTVALLGAAVIAVGSFLPWITVNGEALGGLGSDGVAAVLLATLVVGFVLLRGWGTIDQLLTIVVGGLTVVFALSRLWRAFQFDRAAGSAADFSIGVGIYVTLLGGVVVTVGGLLALLDLSSGPPGPDDLT